MTQQEDKPKLRCIHETVCREVDDVDSCKTRCIHYRDSEITAVLDKLQENIDAEWRKRTDACIQSRKAGYACGVKRSIDLKTVEGWIKSFREDPDRPKQMNPVNREMLIEWVGSYQAQNEQDKCGVLDFKTQLLWRLKDENLFPVTQHTKSMWDPNFKFDRSSNRL
jgi:hypothetical protein